MAALKINFGAIEEVKAELNAENEDWGTLVDQIYNATSMLNYWQGTDAAKYTTAIREKCTELKTTMNSTVEEINKFFDSVKSAYNEVMEANARGIISE